MKRITLAILLIVASISAPRAQQPAPPAAPQTAAPQQGEPPAVTFRVEVNYVEVDAIVTDAQGNVVSDLTASDFELLEDGRAQKISAFSLVNLPIERAERPLFASQPIEPDVKVNSGMEGRIYLIVLDDLHIDATRGARVKAAARRFIQESFGVNDLAAVVYTGGRGADSQDFTNNPRLLLRAIDKFTGRKLPAATLQRLRNLTTNPETGAVGPGADTEEMERAFRARQVMSNVRRLSEFMAGVRGRRKSLLFISEGVDYDIYAAVGLAGSTASSVMADTHDAIAAASRGNVHIYAIDPRGLTAGTEDLIEVSSTFNDVGVSSLQSELRLSQDSLRVLAAETGGFAAVNQNDFNNAFDRIVRENSSYYLLGYYPSNERRDGRSRKLQVRVTSRPGLVVRSRNSYIAPRGRAPQTPVSTANAATTALNEALGSPLPVNTVPMRVFAAPFKGTAPNAAIAVAVEVDATKFDFVEKDGTFIEKIEVIHTATDANGKVFPGERQTSNLTLKPDTYKRMQSRGFRLLSQVDLPPGRYQLRIAAGNSTGKTGSVITDLEVPDFSKEPLMMSGIALTSTSAGESPTVRPKDPLRDYLPGPATATREFDRSEMLALFVEIYENLSNAQAHSIDIRTQIKGEDGSVVREATDRRSSGELQGKSGGYGFSTQLPLSDLTPGLYVIHVEAQSTLGSRPSVSRDVLIRVK